MPKVLLIIVTYQAQSWLDTCMATAKGLRGLADLAVVDNGSTDGTVDRLATEYRDLIDHYFPLDKNIGFGKAHNLVFRQPFAKQYDYYFLLNQDAAIGTTEFRELVALAGQYPQYGILSPLQFRDADNLDVRFARYLSTAAGDGVSTKKVAFVNAAIWLIDRRVVDTIGHFNPIFPHYGEDVNYLVRANLAGFEVGIATEIKAYHYRKPTPIPERLDISPYDQWIIGLSRMVDPTKTLEKAMLQTTYDYFRLCAQLAIRGRWRSVSSHLSFFSRLLREMPGYAAHRKVIIMELE